MSATENIEHIELWRRLLAYEPGAPRTGKRRAIDEVGFEGPHLEPGEVITSSGGTFTAEMHQPEEFGGRRLLVWYSYVTPICFMLIGTNNGAADHMAIRSVRRYSNTTTRHQSSMRCEPAIAWDGCLTGPDRPTIQKIYDQHKEEATEKLMQFPRVTRHDMWCQRVLGALHAFERVCDTYNMAPELPSCSDLLTERAHAKLTGQLLRGNTSVQRAYRAYNALTDQTTN